MSRPATGRPPGAPEPTTRGQRLGVPAYFDPTTTEGMSSWNRFISTAPAGSIAILDVDNLGPGDHKIPEFADVSKRARAAGIKVLGYVETKIHPTPSTSVVRPLADMIKDIRNNAAWYEVNGFFFDEANDFCADAGRDPYSDPGTTPQQYLKDLYSYVKANHPEAIVAMNPGADSFECMMQVSDILCNQETNGVDYLKWTPPSWVSKTGTSGERVYPDSRFWSLVYGVRDVTTMLSVVKHSRTAHAGIVYVTDNANSSTNPDLSNPWSTLPPAPYWSAEINAVRS